MKIEEMRNELIKRIPEMESEIKEASEDVVYICSEALKLSKEDRATFIELLNTEIEGR